MLRRRQDRRPAAGWLAGQPAGVLLPSGGGGRIGRPSWGWADQEDHSFPDSDSHRLFVLRHENCIRRIAYAIASAYFGERSTEMETGFSFLQMLGLISRESRCNAWPSPLAAIGFACFCVSRNSRPGPGRDHASRNDHSHYRARSRSPKLFLAAPAPPRHLRNSSLTFLASSEAVSDPITPDYRRRLKQALRRPYMAGFFREPTRGSV